ncbi:endonuclease V [Moraxella oblonga]|uniref:endonuclease V n=1 Tax=Moraxella oblonga TaxID=200413 RepID=UPI00082971AC|nr:endonuclease V [Moraxella oblonga]
MIYLILDVYYKDIENQTIANVAGIRFTGIENNNILNEYKIIVNHVEPYQSGQFYKREMPCLLSLINQIKEPFDVIIIDGYVYLDGLEKPGLGKYLYDQLIIKKPIIGIAKTNFYGTPSEYRIYRGTSKHPLYVTCINIGIDTAKTLVQKLQGQYRIPDIVKKTDILSRETDTEQ